MSDKTGKYIIRNYGDGDESGSLSSSNKNWKVTASASTTSTGSIKSTSSDIGAYDTTKPARIMCVSNTRGLNITLIEPFDIFIHAGGFTDCNTRHEIRDFVHYVLRLPCRHRILCPGESDSAEVISYLRKIKSITVLDGATTLCNGVRICSISKDKPLYTRNDIVITNDRPRGVGSGSNFGLALSLIEYPASVCICQEGDNGIVTTEKMTFINPSIWDSSKIIHQPTLITI